MLTKGWHGLKCTVCKACDHPHNESRLILCGECDECDISYHIYSLTHALTHILKGMWKCKW